MIRTPIYLAAAAIAGGTIIASTTLTTAGHAQATSQTAATERFVVPGYNTRAARLAQMIRKRQYLRRRHLAKIRVLYPGPYVATQRTAHDCRIVRADRYRAWLQRKINRGEMNAMQAAAAMSRAQTLGRYCRYLLVQQVRRLNVEIQRLKIRYSLVVSRGGGVRH
ncbi:MAG: hypothetical protein AAF942_17805 [Pseudomonadota bacterium]